MEPNDQNVYVIPSNVKARFEFVEGVGWKEIINVAIVAVFCIIIAVLMGIPQTAVEKKVFVDSPTYDINSPDYVEPHYETQMVQESAASPVTRIIVVIMPTALMFFLSKRNQNGQSVMDSVKSYFVYISTNHRYYMRGDGNSYEKETRTQQDARHSK